MKKVLYKVLLALMVSSFVLPAAAKDINLENAKKNILKLYKNINPDNISPSPIPGLYQVAIPPRFFYISMDVRYVVNGNLIETASGKNISQSLRDQSVAAAIGSLDEDTMIIFGDKKLKHTVTVFTDVDCGYCRKLHNEIGKYNKLGIRVRYLAFPRAGIDSASYKKIEAVWCSEDKKKAMTKAKNGQSVISKPCNSPIKQHLSLVYLLGLNGTPAIVLEDGSIVPGYVPAARLIKMINNAKNK